MHKRNLFTFGLSVSNCRQDIPAVFHCILQTTTTVAAVTSDASSSTTSTNVAGIDLALLVDQLTRTGSSPEMTATILSTLVATSPDAGPEEQKQILQKLTEALRERQRQIGLQKQTTVSSSASVSSSATVSAVTAVVTTLQSVVTVSSHASALPSTVLTAASLAKQDEYKPVVTASKELTTKANEPVFSKTICTLPSPTVSVTTSAVVPSMQQWISNVPASSSVTSSSINLSASSTLPATLATTSTGVTHPPVTSALPPAIQQLLSGQSFENLKNILANVTSRKTGGNGIPDQSSVISTGSMVRPHETLDSYTTSKGSGLDLHKMVPESDVLSEKPAAEQDELFVANIHGDVDYRVRPAVPSDLPKSSQPFSVGQSPWVGDGNQIPLPGSPSSQQPDGRYVGGVVTRSLLPGPFSQNSSIQSSGGPVLAIPPRIGKAQPLLPTPESSKPSGDREERGRESQEGRREKSEDIVTNRDRSRYKDRRPFDDRSSSRDDHRRRRSSRERSDVEHKPERRDGRRSTDRSLTRKAGSSSRDSEDTSVKVPHSEEGPIIIDDDCEDIPLPPTTSASKTSDTSVRPAETLTSVSQNSDVDRKVLLPTPEKQVSTGGKRKSDEPRREQKFSRSWESRSSLRSSPSRSKAVSQTKGKKALLETPVASSRSMSLSDSADDGNRMDAKEPRNAKRDSESKSYDRRRSRSRSRSKHIASNLLDRSRRKFGLLRRHRSSSRDRGRSSFSSSRPAATHDVCRRSRSRERPAMQSTSRDQLEEEEQRLRKQLDDLIARKSEGNRSKDNQFSPLYGQDQRREQSSEILPRIDIMQKLDARADVRQPHSRRHLLPAPPLVPANIRGRVPLESPAVLRPAEAERGLSRQIVDRNIGTHYSRPADQPLLPSVAMLPGRPFIQEYSHKPADAHADQFRFGEVTDHVSSRREAEPGRPAFREELGQHRYRPYPKPEDRRRMPPESAERARNWHIRDGQSEETDASSKAADHRGVAMIDRTSAGIEKVDLAEASISEPSSTAFSAVDQTSAAVCQSAAATPSTAVQTPAESELPVTGEVLLPLSSAPSTFSTEGTSIDKSDEEATDATVAAENEAAPAVPNIPPLRPPIPVIPVPPNFPALVQHVRNMMFARTLPRVRFNQLPRPRIPGTFRPLLPPLTAVPVNTSVVRRDSTAVMMSMNRAPAPLEGQSREASAPNKKPLLGDYPINSQVPPLMVEINVSSSKNTGQERVPPQSEEVQNSEEQTCDDDYSGSRLVAPPRLMQSGHQNMPNSLLPVDSVTGEETGEETYEADEPEADESTEQEESGTIPPLMDFSVYRNRSSAEGPIPPLFGPPVMRIAPPNVRGRMPLPRRGMQSGLRVLRPMPPALQTVVEMRGGGGSAAFPRRGNPSFRPRGAPRNP